MTPRRALGSQVLSLRGPLACAAIISLGCETTEAQPAPTGSGPRGPAAAAPPGAPAEAALGVADRGIFADLNSRVQLTLPTSLPATSVSATVDLPRRLLIVAIDGFPRKPYPLAIDSGALGVNPLVALRAGDAAELGHLLAAERIVAKPAARDRDHDGIPDPLDILIGAKKTVLNADAYTDGYVTIGYPMGDVPRTMGVCTDVVIRAVRNAGLDLQQALHEDIRHAPGAYPMVKHGGNANIDHRRVGTLLPYFKRHWEAHTAALDDPTDPLEPGDVVLMDTFPSRSGPDHIGIVSDRLGPSGLPLIINNWTHGTVTAEMDLLTFVPVLHRFRLPP